MDYYLYGSRTRVVAALEREANCKHSPASHVLVRAPHPAKAAHGAGTARLVPPALQPQGSEGTLWALLLM
jgi:hypothetical protein